MVIPALNKPNHLYFFAETVLQFFSVKNVTMSPRFELQRRSPPNDTKTIYYSGRWAPSCLKESLLSNSFKPITYSIFLLNTRDSVDIKMSFSSASSISVTLQYIDGAQRTLKTSEIYVLCESLVERVSYLLVFRKKS